MLTTLPRSKLCDGLSGWRGGDGPELLLIHGVGLRAEAWQPLLTALTQKFSVTAVDLPGHGESAGLSGGAKASLSLFTECIADLVSDQGGKPIVVGHSLGALIAMDMAATNADQINAVVALNAIYRRSDAAAAAVRQRAADLATGESPSHAVTLARWFDDAQTEARAQCAAMLEACDLQAYASAYNVFAQSDAPSDETLRKITMPMMFITGEEEPNSTPEMSRALAAIVPNGRCDIVSGAKHMMPMTHANEVSASIITFARKEGLLHEHP